MPRGTLVAGGTCALILLLAPAAVAPAGALAKAPPRLTGVNYAFYPRVPARAAKRMASGGVRSVRFGLEWYAVEHDRGRYDWSGADATIGNLASRGIDPIPVLFGTPSWASDPTILPPPFEFPVPTLGLQSGNGTGEPPTATAAGRESWPRFVAAAVDRYGRGGTYWHGLYRRQHPTAAPRPVRVWQIWNEPNIASTFWPKPSPSAYAELLRISHDAIAAVDRRARIAIGGLPCRVDYGCVRYLDDLYAQPGVKRDFDIVDIHPYGPTVPFMMGELRQARAVVLAHRDDAAKLWAGEFGWGSAPADSHYNKGRAGQARVLSRAFTALRRHRRSLRIWRVSWFDWRDAQPDTPQYGCSWCGHAGLFDAAGEPKPAWKAFQAAAERSSRRR